MHGSATAAPTGTPQSGVARCAHGGGQVPVGAPLIDDGQALSLERFTPVQWAIIRSAAEQDFYTFTRLMFKALTGRRWVEAPFQRVVCDALQRVYEGDIRQLIINIPPRYGKTWTAVVFWVAWCLAKQPISRFLHSSYSDELINQNSRYVQDVMDTAVYQSLWPCQRRGDADAKRAWVLKEAGGGMNCASVGGQLTGFGAGVTGFEGFSGARIWDDPLKVKDAASQLLRTRANNWYPETFSSRAEHRDVPTVGIAQRIHEDDMTAFLVRGGGSGDWHHLVIPALVEETGQDYPRDFIHGIPLPHSLPLGPIWPYKHTRDELVRMRDDPVTEHVYWSQYQQRPTPVGGGMVQRIWVNKWLSLDKQQTVIDGDPIEVKRVYTDTAQKTGQQHDFSAAIVAARGLSKSVYILDLLHGRYTAPDLIEAFKEFLLRHRFTQFENHMGLNRVSVEDKSSGTGLIQTLNVDYKFLADAQLEEIVGIPRNRDKVSRMSGVTPWIKAGRLHVPARAQWGDKVIDELASFSSAMAHAHDDITDVIMDAIEDLLITDSQGDIDYGRY